MKQNLSWLIAARAALSEVVVGYPETKAGLLEGYARRMMGFPSGLLLLGPPGVGKTYTLKSLQGILSQVLQSPVKYVRTQGSPDLMPEDILFARVADYGEDGRPFFRYQPGTVAELSSDGLPVIWHLDEFDSIVPRTSRGLLQLLEEQAATNPLGQTISTNFFLVATGNSRMFDPTALPIPRATQDRFAAGSVVMNYLPLTQDMEVLRLNLMSRGLDSFVSTTMRRAFVTMVKLTQTKLEGFTDWASMFRVSAGPRGYIEHCVSATLRSMAQGSTLVSPEDAIATGIRSLRGRCEITAEAEISRGGVERILYDMLQEVFGNMEQPVSEGEDFKEAGDEADAAQKTAGFRADFRRQVNSPKV